MSYSLGVDLGTTFVGAAIANGSAQPEMFTLGDRSVVTPAVVYLGENGAVITGDAARRRAVGSPDRVCREFKRRLGDPTPLVLGGTPRTATDLLGTLLHDVVRKVGETEGQPPQRVVLTHPANWGPFRRGLFEEVPNLAGLVDTITTTEPEAAAAYYASSRRLDDGQTVAIYDLGGGTFDATVLRKRAGGVEILGTPEGIERLGGVDFDDAIMSYVDRTAGGAVFELDMADPQTVVALSRLRQDCTLAKEALSVDTEATIPVFLPSRNFDVRLTRSDFEDMVRRPIESTLGALTRTLDSARVAPAELSAVLLIGGSSRIPLVARMISERFDCQIVVDAHPKYAVALGAATLARAAVTQRSNGHANGHADGIATTEYVRAIIATEFSAQRIPSQTPVPVTAGAQVAPVAPAPPIAPAVPAVPVVPVVPVVPAPRLAGPVGLDTLAAATIEIPAPVRAPQATAPAGRSRWPRPTVPTGRARRLLVAAAVLIIGLAGFAILDRLQAAGLATLPGVASGQPAAAQSIPVPELGPSIPVGATPGIVAVSPDGRQAYVANGNAKFVTVVDTASNELTKTIPVDAGPPQSIAFAPDGRRAYLSIYNQQRSIQAIGVLDTATSKIVASIPLRTRPFVAAVAPDGGRLYVPSYDAAAISVIDTGTNKVLKEIKVAAKPRWVELSPDGSRAYVAHESNVISVLDTRTDTVTGRIPVGTDLRSVAVHPTRPLIAAVDNDAGTVSVIDTSVNQVVATVRVGKNPQDLTWAPDGRFLYTANAGDGTVSVVDVDARTVTATVPTGDGPSSVAVLPDGRAAYVTNLEGRTLTSLRTAG